MRRRMAQNRQNGEQVMGPNSALTSFLREQGISAAEISRRHRERVRQEEEEDGEEGEQEEDEEEDEEEQIRQAAKRKRRDGEGSDNEDDEDEDDDEETAHHKATAIRGGKAVCPDCEMDFVINVYSVKNNEGRFLCNSCGSAVIEERRRLNRLKNYDAVKRQKKKVAMALLDSKDYSKLDSLQNCCIRSISAHIDDIEALGDIGQFNMVKINRILSKNRKLNSNTMKLFLYPTVKELAFWDCSSILPQAFGLIPSWAPNLEHLNLSLCGQLSDENLQLIGEKLPKLTSLVIDGAFLVRKDTWIEFFENVGPRLTYLQVGNTHRIDSNVLAIMIENCLEKLKVLKLHQLSGIEDSAAFHLISGFSDLRQLEILSPGSDDDVCDEVMTDDAMVDILQNCGHSLRELKVDGCTGLTDRTLRQIGESCPALEVLSLAGLDQITSDGVINMLGAVQWSLTNLDISRCIGLGNDVMEALGMHATIPHSLVKLNINTLKLFTDGAPLLRLTNLNSVDCGFVPCIDDALVRQLARACKGNLKVVTCYGQPRLTDRLEIAGVRIVGPQQTV